MLSRIFKIIRENGRVTVSLFGIKMKFKNPLVSQLGDCCCIEDLQYILEKGTKFAHPIGIVIDKDVVIGKDCIVFQNVTIGKKYGTSGKSPIIGNNVKIYANSCVIGDVKIGDNAKIGAGAIVLEDVPENAIVAGNPAKIVGYIENTNA